MVTHPRSFMRRVGAFRMFIGTGSLGRFLTHSNALLYLTAKPHKAEQLFGREIYRTASPIQPIIEVVRCEGDG